MHSKSNISVPDFILQSRFWKFSISYFLIHCNFIWGYTFITSCIWTVSILHYICQRCNITATSSCTLDTHNMSLFWKASVMISPSSRSQFLVCGSASLISCAFRLCLHFCLKKLRRLRVFLTKRSPPPPTAGDVCLQHRLICSN